MAVRGLDEGFPQVDISVAPLPEETINTARLAICRLAEDQSDAEHLMDMLGIHPNQKPSLSREDRHKEKRRLIKSINRKRRHGLELNEEEIAFLNS